MCHTLSQALSISNTTAQVVPDQLKALANLSDTNIKRSAVEREDLKANWKSEKTFFQAIKKPIIYQFFKDFTNHRNRANEAKKKLATDLLPELLNTRRTDETFHKSSEQDHFKAIVKISTNMHEKSGSQLFRTTSGIPSGPYILQ